MINKNLVKASVWMLGIVFFISCGSKTIPQATTYDFPAPVDTKDRTVSIQSKKQYDIGSIHVTNKYNTARLNDFKNQGDSIFRAIIEPENTPVNGSPWFGFKIWSDIVDTVAIKLEYTFAKHRYIPKLSYDGRSWTPLSESAWYRVDDGMNLMMKLPVSKDTLWVSAQEIYDTEIVDEWCASIASNPYVLRGEAGKSREGRPLYFLDINKDRDKKKDVIVILSRQHPPEITGFMAMQVFVEEILKNEMSEEFLDRYQVLVYPLLNPDGVDNGQWRHNMGGVDMNRDWAYYNQPETKQIADHIVAQQYLTNGRVVLGLDFHSTQKDVFYTIPDNVERYVIPGFKKAWLQGIEDNIPNYKLNESADPMSNPVTKFWFYTQFKAEGITYEIGDETERDFIRLKGKVSAQQMIRVLLGY
jgi:hypothetical protein